MRDTCVEHEALPLPDGERWETAAMNETTTPVEMLEPVEDAPLKRY